MNDRLARLCQVFGESSPANDKSAYYSCNDQQNPDGKTTEFSGDSFIFVTQDVKAYQSRCEEAQTVSLWTTTPLFSVVTFSLL